MNEGELKKLRVADLKAQLTAAGLDTSGRKDDLVARLLLHAAQPPQSDLKATDSTPQPPKPLSKPLPPKPQDTPLVQTDTSVAISPAAPVQKVVSLAPDAGAAAAALSEAERRKAREARFSTGTAAVSPTTTAAAAPVIKTAAKLPVDGPKSAPLKLGFSEEEKAKMAARAAKFATTDPAVTTTTASAVPATAKSPVAKSPVAKSPVAKSPVAKIPLAAVSEEELKRKRREERFGTATAIAPGKKARV
ncbi:MAG: hypothetical protein SGCHY_002125 [Lobulomycetales sp.]